MRHGETTLRGLCAPIDDLLADVSITDIVSQQAGEVGYLQRGVWRWREVPEFTYKTVDAIGIVAAGLMSKKFDSGNPICDTFLPGGERFTLVQAPATNKGLISFSIRNPARGEMPAVSEMCFDDLMTEADNRIDRGPGDIDLELAALHRAKHWNQFFPLAVKARKTMAATGEKGSGKTTFFRQKIIPLIDSAERLITIENSPEFGKLHLRNHVPLYFGAAGITAEMCYETTLRMGPSRVAIQELRSDEVWALIRLEASGHKGSLTTWHASENDPFTPLVLMAKTTDAGRGIEKGDIEKMLRAFIDIVVFCYRHPITKKHLISSVYYRGAMASYD